MASYHHKDMRPFVGGSWWESTPTKYNKDGTVLHRPASSPGQFYKWFALEPTSKRAGKIMLGPICIMMACAYLYQTYLFFV